MRPVGIDILDPEAVKTAVEFLLILFALAGYLGHDVHDEVPFVRLDSLKASTSTESWPSLTTSRSPSRPLVVALLPEDRQLPNGQASTMNESRDANSVES
jgi:hypothetical protein